MVSTSDGCSPCPGLSVTNGSSLIECPGPGLFTLTQPEYHTGNTFPSLEKCWEGGIKHLFTSREILIASIIRNGILVSLSRWWCLGQSLQWRDTKQMDWGTAIRRTKWDFKSWTKSDHSTEESWAQALRYFNLCFTTKTFICIKYFFLFEPLNFRRVTFMSKIFWKIFHAFFLQGEILFLKISKVIFLSLHFLYPLYICSSRRDNESCGRQILITGLWSDITIIIRHHHDPWWPWLCHSVSRWRGVVWCQRLSCLIRREGPRLWLRLVITGAQPEHIKGHLANYFGQENTN